MKRLLAGLACVATLASGCGLATAGGYVPDAELAGPLEDVEGLDGASIAIGSKNFSESILLGKIALILLKAAGAEVTDLTNIPGSASSRQAQLQGEIAAMWEYTGTGWITYLGHEKPIKDEREQYEAVAEEDLEQNSLVWLPPAPMNNTYGFAVTQAGKEKYGIEKLSQIGEVPVRERTFCVESEFANRPDGLEGMLRTYGVPRGKADGVPGDNIQLYQTGAVYDALASGECTFGEVFTTDGRIVSLDLEVLADDKQYFPNYNVSLVVRDEVLEEHPQVEELVAPVTEELTNEVLLRLNARIDVEGLEPADVAEEWLREEGFIS
ncbi:glycine betaine ABC transporter substrate-binding protein [Nocardioides sp. NPDC092400]|uniref:glycine betaine ABC transporter substrate-binding protein n=1 Tax=Nocardioides sp. NPDC092400 TaxID=3155196 RepID=UPI003449B778